MAVYKSDGSTVFRKGDPGVPDIAAEKKRRRNGRVSSRGDASGRVAVRGRDGRVGRILRRVRRG